VASVCTSIRVGDRARVAQRRAESDPTAVARRARRHRDQRPSPSMRARESGGRFTVAVTAIYDGDDVYCRALRCAGSPRRVGALQQRLALRQQIF
jgi:hypothetical protein